MRPRFSLKGALVVTTVLALTLFTRVQYPTIKAKSSVAAINSGRSDPYELVDRPTGSGAFLSYDAATTKNITAELLKQTWADIWHGRRRFAVSQTWYTESATYDRQHVVVIRAAPLGYRLKLWQEKSAPYQPGSN